MIPNNQVVILQSHSPELPSEEIKSINPSDVERYSLNKKAEESSFQRADIIVFPNEGCQKIYSSLLTKNCDVKYILSGAKNTFAGREAEKEVLKEEKINLMYIGRRNSIKGFDIVYETFKEVAKERDDLNLFIVGKGDNLDGPGIFDVGFSNDPMYWYNSVDYLLNANRKSYFDLSIIEALTTGVPIIMSSNFGHEYYINKSDTITTFSDVNSGELNNILRGPLKKRDRKNKKNFELYNSDLTDSHYFNRFTSFAEELF
ncbi:glycosyltransferase [Sphingobacterium sp. xlx-130]|uniref:glycosyltransferase n=1 Tax=Sphingobacterium sp. xlx-130 TaxID=2654323 RepID=UPI0013DC97EB|nr:glycosyltransferase [Sphingobacterium sp. xlx-130]